MNRAQFNKYCKEVTQERINELNPYFYLYSYDYIDTLVSDGVAVVSTHISDNAVFRNELLWRDGSPLFQRYINGKLRWTTSGVDAIWEFEESIGVAFSDIMDLDILLS